MRNLIKCYVHVIGDKQASLTISDDNGKILVFDHAGCSTKDILEAVGLKESDLFNNQVQEKPKVIKEYFYQDENGKTLYKVMRFEPKSFVQAKYDNGNWIYKMTGVRYVLYNLPNVVKSNEVYFVEGEKDADNLNAIGLTATTSVGGASGFNKRAKEYAEMLKCKTVYIIPDNDKAGYTYAKNIEKALNSIAKEVKILQLADEIMDLKEKQDISDVLIKYGKDKTIEILESLKKHNNNRFPINQKDELNCETFSEIIKRWNIKLSYDVITKKAIISGLPSKYAKEEFSKVLPIYIIDKFKSIGIKMQKNTIDLYIEAEFASNNKNPIKTMFESNEWDGQDRISEIYDILSLKYDIHKKLVKKWLYQTALLPFNNFEHPINSDGVLVLCKKKSKF